MTREEAAGFSSALLAGRVALVTGAARGIGRGCALELARAGADVVVNDRPGSAELSEVADKIRALGRQCHQVEADVFTRGGCRRLVESALAAAGQLDILVSNPAFSRRATFLDYDPEMFERTLQGTLTSGFHLGQLVARHFVERGVGGQIVFISSVQAEMPIALSVAYNAAKAGLNHMARTMAAELCEHRIRVNVIEPGWTDTPGERATFNAEQIAAEGAKLPWGRLGTPRDIGRAAVFLASELSDYVTGAELVVDGGFRWKDCRAPKALRPEAVGSSADRAAVSANADTSQAKAVESSATPVVADASRTTSQPAARLWRVLVVGGGSIGERHLRCLQHTGRAEVLLCEVRDDLREQLIERYRPVEAFANFDSALGGAFDAAVVCTPAQWHVPMGRRLVGLGKHLLLEKPLSTTLEGIAELREEASRAGVVASVAYVYRAHPGLQAMRRVLHEGRVGRPVQVVAVSGQHFPFYRPAYREIYYARRETGGGAIQDALTHVLNAVEWLVGPATRVACDAAHLVLDGVEVEDTVHALTRHGGVLGSLSLNQHQAPNESRLQINCERGALLFEMHASRLSMAERPGEPWRELATFPLERDDLFVRQSEAFLDALEGRLRPACPLAEAEQTLRAQLALLDSVGSRVWQTVVAS